MIQSKTYLQVNEILCDGLVSRGDDTVAKLKPRVRAERHSHLGALSARCNKPTRFLHPHPKNKITHNKANTRVSCPAKNYGNFNWF